MTTNDKNERIRRVLTYIDDHLSEIERARAVVEAVDVSYETLRKQFRKEVGIPPGAYIRQARIDKARRLLVETDEPILVVCKGRLLK